MESEHGNVFLTRIELFNGHIFPTENISACNGDCKGHINDNSSLYYTPKGYVTEMCYRTEICIGHDL
jgi:hypothetical protein